MAATGRLLLVGIAGGGGTYVEIQQLFSNVKCLVKFLKTALGYIFFRFCNNTDRIKKG